MKQSICKQIELIYEYSNQSTPEALKSLFIEKNVLGQKFPYSEDCLNWIKSDGFQYEIDVIFSTPMKNIEFEKNIRQWSAYYNVQLPAIIIEKQNNKHQNDIVLKIVQITHLKGKIEQVSELIGDNSQLNKTDQRIELKAQKLNTPQKLQNKKKCLHHIAVCAFRRSHTKNISELKLVGLSISCGFSLKSRKKTHQEKGLDTNYFKPLDLTKNLQQKKGKQQPVNITNDIEGLQLYFTSPNIRHKIVNLVRKICTEFSSSGQLRKKDKLWPMKIVIDNQYQKMNCLDFEVKKQVRSMDKIQKALVCAKESKCLYIINNEKSNIDDDNGYFQFNVQDKKDEIINAYKNIYQSHTGFQDSDWYNHDYYCNSAIENYSSTIQEDRLTKKIQTTMIDINKCRKGKDINSFLKVQVKYPEDSQFLANIQDNQNIHHNLSDENQGNTEDLFPLQNANKNENTRIINKATEKDEGNQTKKEFIKSENVNNYKIEDLKSENSEDNQPYLVKNEVYLQFCQFFTFQKTGVKYTKLQQVIINWPARKYNLNN